jgi:lipopolysaccharide export system protein LptA
MLSQARTNRLSIRSAVVVATITALPLAIVFTAKAADATNDAAARVPSSAATAPNLNRRAKNDAGELLAATRMSDTEAFTATGSRITYDAAAGQLIFAGSAGSPVEITQNVEGHRGQSLRAHEIIYCLKDGGLRAKKLVLVGSANSQAELTQTIERQHSQSIRAKKITFSLDDGAMQAEGIEEQTIEHAPVSVIKQPRE